MYFTRDNYNAGVIGKSTIDGIVKLKIYQQVKNNDGIWSAPTEFDYNGNDYSTGHPSLSADGKNLYFASDRPGGYGGTDIYVCTKINNNWSAPQNLGAEINTEGNEMFPYISNTNTLYFASNGKPGLGGLDIFSSTINNDKCSTPENMGYPINTDKDDFGLITNSNSADGYFTSNRKGSDDIYSFIKNCTLLKGIVYDEKTLKPIDAASVKIYDMTIEKRSKINRCLWQIFIMYYTRSYL